MVYLGYKFFLHEGRPMARSRRDFIAQSSLGLLGAAIAPQVSAQTPASPQAQTPGAPTVFGTAPPVGPKVSPGTCVEAGDGSGQRANRRVGRHVQTESGNRKTSTYER